MLRIVNDVVGGQATSRLFLEVKQTKHKSNCMQGYAELMHGYPGEDPLINQNFPRTCFEHVLSRPQSEPLDPTRLFE